MKFCSFLNGAPHHKVSYVLRYKKQVSEWTIFFLYQVSEWTIFFMPSEWVNNFFYAKWAIIWLDHNKNKLQLEWIMY